MSTPSEPLPSTPADKPKKVAICGFASSSRAQAPFDDPAYDIWTMNHAPLSWIPKWDALFEIHTLDHLRTVSAHQKTPGEYLDWLVKQPGPGEEGFKPIYMQQREESIKASVPLPREEMNAWFLERAKVSLDALMPVPKELGGWYAKDYYTSTISYMVSLALLERRPAIELYGVDLLQDDEYAYQRAGAEYLIGFARGMGVPVYVPAQSAMCKANFVYGVTEMPTDMKSLQPLIEYIDSKAKASDKLLEDAHRNAHLFNGAMQMADLVLKWVETPEEGKTLAESVKAKREDMAGKLNQVQQNSLVMQGQAEAFRTSVVWSKHFARGGELKP